jgi:TP901 family phage tail tape measure protein
MADVNVLIRATDEASGPLRNVSGALTSLGDTAHHAGGMLGEMASSLAQGLLIGAGFAVFNDLAGSIENVVTSAGNFQQSLQNVQNNTTMTTTDVAAMHDAVLTLANETGAPLDQLTSGFQHVMNITGSTATSLDILRVATDSAVSTGGNASDTANVLANAMHEYGVDTLAGAEATGKFTSVLDAATSYMGVFHLAAAEGNMTLEQFSESSGRAIGVAANLGIPVEQVAAAFTALTKHGFDAAGAGVQVTDIMTHMINPTAAARKELERVSTLTGVNLVADFSAAGLHAKGFTGVIADLHAAYLKMGLSEAEAEGETMKLVNAQRGGLGMAALLGTAASDYASILGDVSDKSKIANVTSDALARTQATLAGQWNILKDHIQTSSIELGERFLPALTAAVGFITGSGLSGIASFGTVIGQTFLPALRAVGDALSTAFGGVSGAGMASGLKSLADTLQNDVLPRFSAWIIVTAQQLTPALTALVGFVLPALQQIGAFIQGTVLPAWGQLLDTFGKIGAAVQSGVGAVIGVLVGAEAAWLGKLAEWGAALIGWIAPAIPPLLTALGGLLSQLGAWVSGTALPAIHSQLQVWAAEFGLWVTYSLPPMLTNLGTLLGAFDDWAGGTALPAIRAQLASWSVALAQWVNDAWPMLKERLGEFSQRVDAWLGDALPALAGYLLQWGQAFITWIVPATMAMRDNLGPMLDSLGGWLANSALPAIQEKLAQWGQAFITWVAPEIPVLIVELVKLLAELSLWITFVALPTIVEKLLEWGVSFVAWVAPRIPEVLLELGKLLLSLTDWAITTAVPAMVEALFHVGTAIVTGIMDGLAPLGQQLDSALRSAIDSIHIDIGPFHLSAAGFSVDSPPPVTVVTNEVHNIINSVSTAVAGAVGARAAGGPVTAGMPYIVGEQRPELFVPQTNGFIMPNVPSSGGGGSGWSGGGDFHVHMGAGSIVIQGHVLTDQQLVDTVHTGLLKKLRSNPSLGLAGYRDRNGIGGL